MNQQQKLEIEAATFRRLVRHLRGRRDLQNIELMSLAGFCRNCLSKWYQAEAEVRGQEVEYEDAREMVYGMPYADWKAQHQTEATAEQMQAFERHQREKNQEPAP